MKRIIPLFSAFILISASLFAQEEIVFTATISQDTVLMGNRFEVTYTLENARGAEFQIPGIDQDFYIVGGPNTSTSMQIVNGSMSQQQSWSYYLVPKSEGIFYIPGASVKAGGDYLNTPPLEIWVNPNPDGLPNADMPDPVTNKPKKKRPITRI